MGPLVQNLQCALGRFVAKCEVAGMRVSSTGSRWNATFWVGAEIYLKWKYLGVLFTRDGRMEQEMDQWIGASSSVKKVLLQLLVVKEEVYLCFSSGPVA